MLVLEKQTFEKLTPNQKDFIQERLPLSLPLHVAANLIHDGIYWKRRCEQRWRNRDISDYGHSWKRMFFERHLENAIELFIPDVTEPKTVLDVLPLCKNDVRRLNISQLLLPVQTSQGKKDERYDSDLSMNGEEDEASMDHFDFGPVLSQLKNLEELHLVYRIKQCGMNFEWSMFQITDKDCRSLAMAVKSCKRLKVNVDFSPNFIALHSSQKNGRNLLELKYCKKKSAYRYLYIFFFLSHLISSENC